MRLGLRGPGLRAVARIDGLRRGTDAPDTATGCQIRYVALSRVPAPAEALRIVRSYGSMENDQPWLPDIAFRDDGILARNENAARNLALIRRMALNNLRRDPTKASIHTKMQMAGWDDDFLRHLIRHMR